MATYFEGYEIESCPRFTDRGWLVKAVIAGSDQEIVCEDGNEFPTYEEAAEASFALGRRWVWSRRDPGLKL
jgi:hypothetical protein